MAVRIRKDGRVVCAAMFPEEECDVYIDDNIHYTLSVILKVLVTESHEKHKVNGQWYWEGRVPNEITIDKYYLKGE